MKKKISKKHSFLTRHKAFIIKLIISLVAVVLSYRYPINGLLDQGLIMLIIVSIFLFIKPSPVQNFIKNRTDHVKLFTGLLLLLVYPVLVYLNTMYLNWDNAQMIKGLARDFPMLVSEIEQATGLELEQKVDCSTTTEKFSDRVRTCELSVAKLTNQEIIDKSVEIILAQAVLKESEYNEESNAYRLNYRNNKTCTLSGSSSIYLACITVVRDDNIDLAREVFFKK